MASKIKQSRSWPTKSTKSQIFIAMSATFLWNI